MDVRRPFFWIAVGGTAILANFLVELAATKLPNPGLRQFVGFIHRGPGGASQ
jgi:hypothetical protein